jgi:WD40 repeat protein
MPTEHRPGQRDVAPKHALPIAWSQRVDDYATTLTVSADGQLLAVGNGGGTLYVLDANTGAIAFQTAAHPGGVLGAAFSAGEPLLATVGQDGYAHVHDASGRLITSVSGGSPWVEQVAWAPDGGRFVTTSGRSARMWTRDGMPVWEAEPAESTLTGLAWNRRGTEVAVACYGGVSLLEAKAGKLRRRLAWRGSIVSLAWSPNDAVVACGTQECTVHFWRLASGKDSAMSGYTSKPRALSWDRTGKLLATGGDPAISVWSFEGKGPERKQPTMLTSHRALCTTLAFHPEQAWLASGADDTGVILWHPRTSTTPVGFGFLEDTVTALAWADGGRMLVGTDSLGVVRAWRPRSLQ